MENSRSWSRWRSAVPVAAALAAAALALSSMPARAFDVDVSEAPTDDLSLTLSAIHGAQQSLLLNIYELSSSDIADALIERVQAGVHVEIIEEGQPVGGLSAAARGIETQIAQAMKAAANGDHLYEMIAHPTSARRFRFDHGKYAVIDGDRLLIGSENYSPTGNPQPGTKGNRGWEVLIHDPDTAQQFQQVFTGDSDMSHGDLIDLARGSSGSSRVLASHPKPQPSLPAQQQPAEGVTTLQADSAQKITSPDTSLSGLLGLIQSATQSLDIEQMTFNSAWGHASGNSPLYDAVLSAARRGVRVRILLNDERVFDHPGHPSKHKNPVTADGLNQAAQQEGLDLSVRIANLSKMKVDYIHNKGALADSDRTLISSINWDENSVEHNREAAVVITGVALHDHYEALFQGDWDASASGRGAATTTAVP